MRVKKYDEEGQRVSETHADQMRFTYEPLVGYTTLRYKHYHYHHDKIDKTT